MPKINTIKPKEDFIVQANGDYNMLFQSAEVTGPRASGDVIEVGGYTAIASEEIKSGETKFTRVMVRGNPTSVDYQKLDFGSLVEADAIADMEAHGILIVNQ